MLGKLFSAFLRLYNVALQKRDLLSLPPDEKIRVGEELLSIARDLEEVLKHFTRGECR